MAIFTVNDGTLCVVKKTTFAELGIRERQDLQQWIKNNISILGEELLVISEEFGQWESSKRLDLLAVDRTGNLVVVELKRDENGSHAELQALRYAAMVSTMRFSQAVEAYEDYLKKSNSDHSTAKTALLEFIGSDDEEPENFASDTRIILVAAEFSKELCTTVMFLNERGLDVRCVRIAPHALDNGALLLDVQQTIPLPESKDYQIQVQAKAEERRKAIKNSVKDLSKFLFQTKEYGKGRLVQAVVAEYLKKHPNIDYIALENAFPKYLQGSLGVFARLSEHKQRLSIDPVARYFADMVFTSSDNQEIVICSQWGKGNIDRFVSRALELGFVISKVEP